ncbi:uncharacterized protein LOC128409589 isoform X1 [Podarcis raffonei]|uniref:uncharacterized protein LOC128409589 isoform X1 n=2 Tax=Podarcis raffonei TaxID=65483 RepID=UPI0023291B0F|nr:uncharacterized protein LOC128409589 isoform X1 [Podarcis raffonei]
MDIFLKDLLEPSQRDIFNHLTRTKTTMAVPFKSALKDRALVSSNIGIPPHLIHRIQYPAYTSHTSPVVKKLAEQDKLRISKLLSAPRISYQGLSSRENSLAHIPQQKRSRGSQDVGVAAEPSPAVSRFSIATSPLYVSREFFDGGLVPISSFLPEGASAPGNFVIFAKKRVPFRVLPMKPLDASSIRKGKKMQIASSDWSTLKSFGN